MAIDVELYTLIAIFYTQPQKTNSSPTLLSEDKVAGSFEEKTKKIFKSTQKDIIILLLLSNSR